MNLRATSLGAAAAVLPALLAGLGEALVPAAFAEAPRRRAGDAEGGARYVEAGPSNPSRVVAFDVEVAGASSSRSPSRPSINPSRAVMPMSG